VLNKNPSFETQLNAAIASFQQGNYPNALEILLPLTKTNSSNAFVWFLTATVFAQFNQLEKSEQAFLRAIAIQPNYPEAFNNLGVVYEKGNNIDLAREQYENAISLKPDYINALYNLGNVYQTQHQLDKAAENYLQALHYKADYLLAINNLGLVYIQQKKYKEAESILTKGTQYFANDLDLFNNLGQAYFHQQQWDKALVNYKKAYSVNPKSPEVHNNIALVHQEKQDFDAAITSLQTAIDLRPNYVEAITNLGNLYKNQSNIALAKQYYNKALEINHGYPEANTNLGMIQYREGNYHRAYTLFQIALKANPNQNEARYNLASYELAHGNYSAGWAHYWSRPTPINPLCQRDKTLSIASLQNKKVLIFNEQGIGDELILLRFCKDLRKLTQFLAYAPSPKLQPVLSNLNLFDCIEDCNHIKGQYDHVISIGDLPTIILDTQNPVPPSVVVTPQTTQIQSVGTILSELGPPPYTAFTWRAGTNEKNCLSKHINIATLWNVLQQLPGTLIQVQRLPEDSELNVLKQLSQDRIVHDLSAFNDDLQQMIALMTLIDEYIGVSNTNMHLRLSVNRNAHVLLPHPADWRWTLNKETSPWFPGFSLYRQTPTGDWNHALQALRKNLMVKHG